MMEKHKPGPWTYEADTRDYNGIEEVVGWNVYGADRSEIVGCEGVLGDGEANARLIAASPELLDALRNVLQWVPGRLSYHSEEPTRSIERARVAIAKATGGAS